MRINRVRERVEGKRRGGTAGEGKRGNGNSDSLRRGEAGRRKNGEDSLPVRSSPTLPLLGLVGVPSSTPSDANTSPTPSPASNVVMSDITRPSR